MRNLWLALAIGIPSLYTTSYRPSLIAAEKSRDWQSGLVVESKAQTDPKIHAIAAATRTYIVRGTVAGAEDAVAVGATVRFAIQGTTMFLSIDGGEYKLSVLGTTVRTTPPPAAQPTEAPLDNDAIVKMIVGGLKEETVVSVIQARPGKYVLGAEALGALKAAGVTQPVIAAMSAKMNAQH